MKRFLFISFLRLGRLLPGRLEQRWRRQADDCGHPEGDQPRLLADDSRRGGEGGSGARRDRDLAGSAARGRPRFADLRDRGLHHARRVRHRHRPARRDRARAAGRRRAAAEHPGRRLRLGAEERGFRQLRGHRQSPGRPDGGRARRQAAERQRQGPAAAVCRRARQHDAARRGIPGSARQPQGHRDRQLEPVSRRRRRGRGQARRSDPQQLPQRPTAASASMPSSASTSRRRSR